MAAWLSLCGNHAAMWLSSVRELRPVAVAFVAFGAFWGAWAVAAADIERSLRVSHTGFGLLLSAGLIAGAAANAIVGSVSERWGTTVALAWALMVWGAILAVGAAVPAGALAFVMIGVFGGAGAVDVVMNIAATAALAGEPGQLVRFHGFFNIGAAVGALATGLVLRAGGSWRWSWWFFAVVIIALAHDVRSTQLPAGEAGEPRGLTEAVRVVWRERLVVLAIAFAIGAMVEGGIETWGVLSLRERVGSGVALGAGSAVVAYSVAAFARVVLGPRVAVRGAATGVAVGAGAAAAGLAVLAVVNQPVVAAAGLVLAAAGISMCWPLLLAHASGGAARPGDVVGGVSAVGYLGLVVGPSLVGAVAGAVGLRAGLLVLAAAAVAVAIGPATVSRRAPAGPSP